MIIRFYRSVMFVSNRARTAIDRRSAFILMRVASQTSLKGAPKESQVHVNEQ